MCWSPLSLRMISSTGTALCVSFPEGGCDKAGAHGMGYTVSHAPAGKQVDDGVKIDSGIVDLEIGDIADPYLIGTIRSKMPLQQISLFTLLQLHIELFRICGDALQTKLLHNGRSTFCTDLLASSC